MIKFLIENRFKCKGKLSKIYEILQKSTFYSLKTEVKEKWEKELKIDISIESWRESLKGNTRITQSKYWDEFSWKVQQRFFITPDKCSKTQTLGTSCWRNCGEQRANYTHIFFLCPGLEIFWKEFGKAVKYIFDLKSLTLENLLGLNLNKITLKNQKLFNILRIAAIKQITRTWKQVKAPVLSKWHITIENILNMEKLTFRVRNRLDKWYKIYPDKVVQKMQSYFNNNHTIFQIEEVEDTCRS